jgi:DNA transposition AAA+ family ATPase
MADDDVLGVDGGGGQNARSSWKLSGDHVVQATAELDERSKQAIRWMFFYCLENDLSQGVAAEKIGYSPTVVSRICRGQYEGSLDAVVSAIESWRRICDARADAPTVGFVETTTSRKIWKMCDAALTYQTIAKIYGDPQIGKTWALEAYWRQNNHGRTKFIRLPAAAGVQMMLRCFADACGISSKCSFEAMRIRVLHAIDGDNLVIVDELHQAFNTYQKHARVACLELIREIHDRTGCGMVLCGTNVARDEIENGQHKLLLEQLDRRGIFTLQLPKYATWADREAIAKSFGLDKPADKARELVDAIVRTSGLKAYTSFLRAAARLAANRKTELTWEHFMAAYRTIRSLSQYEKED